MRFDTCGGACLWPLPPDCGQSALLTSLASPDTLRPPIATTRLYDGLPLEVAACAGCNFMQLLRIRLIAPSRSLCQAEAGPRGKPHNVPNGRILHDQADTGLMSSHLSVPRNFKPTAGPQASTFTAVDAMSAVLLEMCRNYMNGQFPKLEISIWSTVSR